MRKFVLSIFSPQVEYILLENATVCIQYVFDRL